MEKSKNTYVRLRPETTEPEIKPQKQNRTGLKVLGIAAVTIGVLGFVIYVAEKKSDELL